MLLGHVLSFVGFIVYALSSMRFNFGGQTVPDMNPFQQKLDFLAAVALFISIICAWGLYYLRLKKTAQVVSYFPLLIYAIVYQVVKI